MGMEYFEVKRFDPVSLGKISAVMMTLTALLTLLIYLPMLAFTIPLMGNIGLEGIAAGAIGALLMAVVFIVLYAGLGFLMGLIAAFVYNAAAKRIGGLRMKMEIQSE